MKRTLYLIMALALMLALLPTTAFANGTAGPVTKNYGDYTLPNGAGYQFATWNLNKGPVTITYTLDLSGAPNVAYTGNYGQSGQVGLIWWDGGPAIAGALMTGFLADWDNSGTEFPTFPDKDNTQDLDDKFNLQRFPNPGSWSETQYDVVFGSTITKYTSPIGSGDNYGIWFDRDGVDPWQDDDPSTPAPAGSSVPWGSVNGGTYNTNGTYKVKLIFQKLDATTGVVQPIFFPDLPNDDAPGDFGVPTGFSRLSGDGYQYFPAGISFDTDETQMAAMRVLVQGNSGNGTIMVKDLEVTGYPSDNPVTTNVIADPNPAPINGSVQLSATVESKTDVPVGFADYSLDSGTTWQTLGDPWPPNNGTLDVSAEITAPNTPGIYDLCVRGVDNYWNYGDPECILLVVYDPSGGFVTGGGWITSPEGAMSPTVSNVTVSGVSGDTSTDPDAAYAEFYLRYVGNPPPAGFDPAHNYQWGSPAIFTPSPEDGPVTLVGSIDVDNQTIGQVAMIGLLDRDDLASGNSSFQRGAYIYVYRSSATSWRIGPSDGNVGGEIVQTFITIADTDLPADGILDVEFTLDGTTDGTTCVVGSYTSPAGCMTLQITGGTVNATLTDSYGDVVGNNSASPEFANGAVPGWDDYLGSYVGYTLTVPSITSGSPKGKATFGFVSKYKKGANTPTGNTEFQFNAGDLNFHSSDYDWLVVTGSDFAKFKGTGTINGEGTYKFQIWAGDNDPGGDEVVVYDNGMNQPIGGGSIVVHKAK
jgi:hypothetical protein